MNRKIIGIDFDGTCVTHEFPNVGREIGAEPVLERLVSEGARLILWTMRSDGRDEGFNPLSDAVAWFQSRGIPLFGINENPEQKSWTGSPKAYCHLYIDDAALGAPLTKGKNGERDYINWKKVSKILWPLPKKGKSV